MKQSSDQWPISHDYRPTKSATGWVDVGPATVPWHGGFYERNAAEEIARLIAAAPELLQVLKELDSLEIDKAIEDHIPYPARVGFRLAWLEAWKAISKAEGPA